MQFLGIDPGLSGAIGVLDIDGNLLDAVDMPTLEVGSGKARRVVDKRELHRILRDRSGKCVIEQVSAMPGQGVSSVFRFGEGYGVAHTCITLAGLVEHRVTPAKWKRDMGLGKSKDGARARAMELWPDQAGLFRRKKYDGRAEAALLARWLWERER